MPLAARFRLQAALQPRRLARRRLDIIHHLPERAVAMRLVRRPLRQPEEDAAPDEVPEGHRDEVVQDEGPEGAAAADGAGLGRGGAHLEEADVDICRPHTAAGSAKSTTNGGGL